MGGAGRDHLDGGAGTDRATYFAASGGVTVDLQSPGINTGEAFGDTFVSIEDIQGSAFADNMLGNGAANTLFGGDGRDFLSGRGGADTLRGMDGNDDLMGGTGADLLDGGAGIDQASYRNSGSGLTVDLAFAGNNSGDAAGDTFVSIENLFGSAFDDSLRGNDSANELRGGDGDDWLSGRGGRDILLGGDGNDVLAGGTGRDVLDGGAGIDRADYSDCALGITVDLRNAANNTRDASGDTFVSIENLYGTAFNDNLTGDAGDNTIWGANGNDRLQGAGGNDRLLGMNGNDQLNGGYGDDTLTGGAGFDTFIFAFGADLVTDFTLGEDTLRLADSLWNGIDYSVEDVIALFASREGASTVMTFSNGDMLTLEGITDPEALSDSIMII
jgi:serralysin